jgi:secreted trypsin-like serine protease
VRDSSRAKALLVALSTVGASCFSGAGEPMGTSAQPIIGGSTDATDSAVVALLQPSTQTLCSGTIIAPTVVLTAAHCVYGVSPADLQVLTGPDETAPEQTLAVQSVAAYPTYTGESTGLQGGVDLGVVYLAAPVSITPISVRTDVSDPELTSTSLTLIGYGLSSTTDPTTAGIRRSVVAPVDSVCSRIITAGDSDANECQGDSGGPVLLGGQLIAVISSGMLDCTAPSNQMRLSAHTLWLAAVLAGKTACPGCVEPDPSCDALIEGESADAAAGEAGSDDAAPGDGAAPPKPGPGGGCSLGATAPGSRPASVVTIVLALLARRRRRGPPRLG